LLCRGFPSFDQLKKFGENAFAARFVVAGKAFIRINPAVAPLLMLAALEPIHLVEAVAFEVTRPARLSLASGEARFNDCA
jgi:hypothetical protein